ncbi:uncharacterized protein PGTG_14547 [Puccinia graminis f. sp. tritici CRL 75-36-700-3]|uniref:Uncharacterized protein n=1 Tax=Puccinia graminis f. sp. tritici (strain CRL 75-36-700-3 / race SCCL) TaxID=418459 RepID=E3KU57_PUCGT|nr:uncharacterized protein PGTG_14547 [Puccinia graminis f. sp. tritici CRL 75-36-700-3]EFP87832.2 hypothetical protein PGTG_14547 [Puccinia graminis f. sp. tritici CRL 75-36-700-3]
MSGNHSWQPLLAHAGHHPITYSGPPQYLTYSAPMSYMAPTSYQHSGPVYTGQPHYPYSAAPQSHLAPMGQPAPPYYHHPSMPIYAPPPSQHMFFPGHSEPTYWPIQTNSPHPPVNYASRPSRAATFNQPSNTPAPQQPFTSGVDSKASVQTGQQQGDHTVGDGSNLGTLEVHEGQIEIDTHESIPKEGSQFNEPGASGADLGWDLGIESANFHELKSSFLPHGPAEIDALAPEGADVWRLAPSETCPVDSTVAGGPIIAVEQPTSMGLDLEMGDGLGYVEGGSPATDEALEAPLSGMQLNNAGGSTVEGVPPSGRVLTSLDVDNFDFSVGNPMDPPPLYRFHEYKDLKRFAKRWARAHKYKLVTGSSKTGKNGYLKCSLAGEDRNKPDTNRQRLSRNKRIGCRFRISHQGSLLSTCMQVPSHSILLEPCQMSLGTLPSFDAEFMLNLCSIYAEFLLNLCSTHLNSC